MSNFIRKLLHNYKLHYFGTNTDGKRKQKEERSIWNRRKKEGPSDLIHKTEVRENQEPPLGVTVSSNIGGFSGQIR